jgi:ribosomal protein S18 acetylase RimI-like enzyme
MSDGEIQARLLLIAVDSAYRRRGIAGELIMLALRLGAYESTSLLTAQRSSALLFRTFGWRASDCIPTT